MPLLSPASSTLEQKDDMDNTEDHNNAPPQQQDAVTEIATKSDDEHEDAWIEVPQETADAATNKADTAKSDMHDDARPEIHVAVDTADNWVDAAETADIADAANNNTVDKAYDGKAISSEGDATDNNVDKATTAKFKEDKVVDIALNQTKQEEDEEELQPDESVTREDLMIALGDITSPGSTCTGGPTSLLPDDPGLRVDGVGLISMPLTEEQAKALSEVAAQAPHGQGMKTVIDTSVRNTWQIEPDQVTIEHPSWSIALQELTAKVAIDLGLSPNDAKCTLYKLLLYEKGGFFKTHKDTEKVNGMFGTLVVQLPSRFTGGTFVVTHNGVTTRFDLGSDTGRSAEGCFFVAHYADCEHAIEEVTSGNRLALVYSLSFTGVGSYKTSSPVTGSHERKLKRILRGLDVNQRICMIPLHHQYTTASLARLGLNALKGKDRDCQKAMESASDGTWKFIIACVYKTDLESGSGDRDSRSFHFDFVIEPGVPYFVGQAFGVDGSDCTSDLAWLRKIANFCCVEDGGMLLVSSPDDMKEIWGEGDSGSVEYTGNDGATRETTYEAYLLVTYAAEMEFDWMVSGDLARCIDVVATEKDESKILRLLNHFSRSYYGAISLAQFERLLPLVSPSTVTPCEGEIANLKQLFGALNMKATDAITKASFDFLDWFATAKDTSPEVKAILEAFFSKSTSSAGVMLLKAEMAAYLVSKPSCDSLAGMLACVAQSLSPGNDNTYSRSYYDKSTTSDDDIKKMSCLVKKYSWALAKDTAMAMAHIAVEREMTSSLACFGRTMDVLISLLKFARDDAEFQQLCGVVATKFENDIEKPALFVPGFYGRKETTSYLLINASTGEKVFKLLLSVGNAGFIVPLQAWVDLSPDTDATLEKVERTLRSADASTQHANKDAVQTLLESLKKKIRASKLAALLVQRDALLQETQTPPPAFSWSMPEASYPQNAEIQEFLRGPQQCLPHLVVGGGARNARLMSSNLVHSTFSATISAGRSTGKDAYVTVAKTRKYHEIRVKKYDANMEKRRDVESKIRRLEEKIASSARVVDASPNQERPPKKVKVPAAMPEGS